MPGLKLKPMTPRLPSPPARTQKLKPMTSRLPSLRSPAQPPSQQRRRPRPRLPAQQRPLSPQNVWQSHSKKETPALGSNYTELKDGQLYEASNKLLEWGAADEVSKVFYQPNISNTPPPPPPDDSISTPPNIKNNAGDLEVEEFEEMGGGANTKYNDKIRLELKRLQKLYKSLK